MIAFGSYKLLSLSKAWSLRLNLTQHGKTHQVNSFSYCLGLEIGRLHSKLGLELDVMKAVSVLRERSATPAGTGDDSLSW